jgi:pyrophosphate--fructose-6-phosphate 1-phosphotransferase
MESKPELRRVAILTAGGLAPCLSSAVGALIERYTELAPGVDIIVYRGGYQGLLLGSSFTIGRQEREEASLLHGFGGSPIGNSRVKLSNVKDCLKRGLVKPGQDPRKVAADRLVADRVDVLHTIGGDDTNTAAADLADFLAKNNYRLTVIGLPKTIDNDVFPIVQTLGALTAAEEGARFFRNVVADHTASHRSLIVHEVMGRNCGWLTAQTAREYLRMLDKEDFAPTLNAARGAYDVHAVYIPEVDIDVDAEAARLTRVMDANDTVNIFISEGAGADAIAKQLRAEGKEIPVDAFGHMRLDAVNVGQWFGERFMRLLKAEKLVVQKSGYFARAAPANGRDIALIQACADMAVTCALRGESGVVGHDEDRGGQLRAIEFPRIKGHKLFDPSLPWYTAMLQRIGQKGKTATSAEPITPPSSKL